MHTAEALKLIRQPLAEFPLTGKLYEHILTKQRGRTKAHPNFVSESLIDDILRRVSPYFHRNKPVDVVDLWPGCGLLSSKVNELLQPRRHILVEANKRYSKPFLQPLCKTNPGYKLVEQDIYQNLDWAEFLAAHLPEQGPQDRSTAYLPKNDTLLVLANLPAAASKHDHFRPSRWWLRMLTACLFQSGLFTYGSVRILATSPYEDVAFPLPRSTSERTRTSMLAESLSLHTIEIARSANTQEPSHLWRNWYQLEDIRKRVAERAAANGIVSPPERKLPPLEAVPQTEIRKQKEVPYEPRPFLDLHRAIFEDIAAGDATGLKNGHHTLPEEKALMKARSLAITKLARDNKIAYTRQKLATERLHVDELIRNLSRAATDPKESVESLKALSDEIVARKAAFTAELAGYHFVVSRHYDKTVDDARWLFLSQQVDGIGLLHDQRPFEPLLIGSNELYPRETSIGMVYFEAQSSPPALQKIYALPDALIPDAIERLYVLMSIVDSRGDMVVSELFSKLFPHATTNDLVRDIPTLAVFAEKTIKPGRGPMPLPDGVTTDPISSYQENVDYDLREVRLRVLGVPTLVDIVVKYETSPDKMDFIQFRRSLGGSMTAAQIDEEFTNLRTR